MKILRNAMILIIMLSFPTIVLAGNYAKADDKTGAMNEQDIIETARSAGSFNTLITAIDAADLTDTLRSEGPFTVFAPTDAAFAQLPSGTVENLLKRENRAQLQALLTYHVVSGKVMSSDAAMLASAKSVNGQSFRITKSGDGLMVDDANVIKADINSSNGVIHVIDRVIVP